MFSTIIDLLQGYNQDAIFSLKFSATFVFTISESVGTVYRKTIKNTNIQNLFILKMTSDGRNLVRGIKKINKYLLKRTMPEFLMKHA